MIVASHQIDLLPFPRFFNRMLVSDVFDLGGHYDWWRKGKGIYQHRVKICRRTGCKDVVVSEQDLNRYMRLGYKVLCAYYDGKQYKNIYQLEGKLHFVW